jgi:SOS regulatory protein LexA
MQSHLKQIISFFAKCKRLPSYREMLPLFKYKSTNAVHKAVAKLINAAYLSKDKSGKLVPGNRFQSLKILGTVEAGFPSAAEEELVDTISLDEFLIGNREATYMLTVQGESMIDAGIHPGDIALVERGRTAKPGDIVIAEVDNGWTIKYLRKSGSQLYLEPANKRFKPIYPKEELNIAAIVTAVIRKYKNV